MNAPQVVKLGGSLGASAHLGSLLASIPAARRPTVIVPGGGPFADAVRDAQALLGFDAAVAHDLALLAMAQFGRVLAARGGFRCATGAAAVRAACREQDSPIVWLPDPAADALDIERSWRVSSDSLALWLADRLAARRVVLVKSCREPPAAGWPALAHVGVVDAAFPATAAAYPEVSIRMVYAARAERLAASLASDT